MIGIYFFQLLFLPFAHAQLPQKGVFVRDGGDQENGSSFRSKGEEEEGGSLKERSLSEGGLKTPFDGGSNGMRESSAGAALIYQIHLLGEVKRPGTYRIAASTRLSEALLLAGGIKKSGSERNLELRRLQARKRLDLMAYKMFGELENNPYLVDNDVIFVPLKGRTIQIEGAVNRPGIYELKGEKVLVEALKLGGGFSQGASHKDPIRIVRFDPEEKKTILEIPREREALRETPLFNGDVIVIPHIFTTANKFDYNLKKLPNDNLFYPSYEDRVFVIGAVNAPGPYGFSQYYKVSNYLAMAGGTTRMAKSDLKVIDSNGQVRKVKPDSNITINPGDTVYVPEKAFSREGWLQIANMVISLGLAATNTAITISR